MTKHVVTQMPNDHTTKAGVAIRPFDLEHDLATIVKSDNAMSTELTINGQHSLTGYGPEWFTKRFTEGRSVHLNWRGLAATIDDKNTITNAAACFCLWHLHTVNRRLRFVEVFWLRVESSYQRRGVARALLAAVKLAAEK